MQTTPSISKKDGVGLKSIQNGGQDWLKARKDFLRKQKKTFWKKNRMEKAEHEIGQ